MIKITKNKKMKKIIFVLILFCFLIPSISLVFAQNAQKNKGLEVSYPDVGTGIDAPQTVKVYFPYYIQYIYKFAVIAGGIIALLALVYGGVRYLTSAGNPSATKDAREQIFAGLIGLVVILGSYVVLYEINPDLTSLELPKVGDSQDKTGVIFYNKKDCAGLGSKASIPELISTLEEDVSYLARKSSGSVIMRTKNGDEEYPLSLFSFHSSKNLKIELFTDETCSGKSAGTLTDLEANKCYEIDRIDIKCVKFIWWKPGVWVFNELDNKKAPDPLNLPAGWEEGEDYKIFRTSQPTIPSPFHENIKAIALVPDNDLKLDYGIVMHNIYGGFMKEKGFAQIILPGNPHKDCTTSDGVTRCNTKIFKNIGSITIFNLPQKAVETSYLHTVAVCRQDRCGTYRKEGESKDYEAKWILKPGSDDKDGIEDITDKVGGDSMYSSNENVVFAKSFGGKSWPDLGEPILNNGRSDSGISGIEIETGARYLVLLYNDYTANTNEYNWINRLGNDMAILNRSETALFTIEMNERTGTIVVIRTRTE